jgi:histone H3/H4
MKKPQSAFFIFSGERRQEIKDELLKDKETVSMGEVAKAIGSAWKALSDEERQRYQGMAAEQKDLYNNALKEADGGEAGGEVQCAADQKARAHSMLPLSMVKKVAMKDEDVNRVSGDALKVITEATGLFLGNLASKSLVLALGNNRKNFKFEDMVKVAKRDPKLVDMGLLKAFEEQEPFKGWLASSGGANVQRKRTAEGACDAGGKKKAVAANGGIAAFLSKKMDQGEEVVEEVVEKVVEEFVEEVAAKDV